MSRNASAGATAAQLTSTSSRPARRTASSTIRAGPSAVARSTDDGEGRIAARLGHGLCARGIDVGDRDGPAARRHLPADRGAEALRAARDQDDRHGLRAQTSPNRPLTAATMRSALGITRARGGR